MLKLAFLNLFRYRKRTIITAIAIGVGIAIGIFSVALLDGVDAESNRNLLWYETGSAKIYENLWYAEKDDMPIEYLISEEKASSLEKDLKDSGITSYTKEFVESADASFYEDPFPSTGSITGTIHAISSDTPSIYQYDKSELEGEWISKGSEGVVVGAKLADDMGAELGYYITLQTKGKGGFLQAFDVPIIGIINTGNPIVDSTSFFFGYDFIDEILELDGSYSSFAISYGGSVSSNIKTTEKEISNLKSIAASNNLVAHDWKDIASDIIALAQSKSSVSSFIIFLLFLIAVVGVTNTMVMAINERKNEIAMFRSLGYRPTFIKTLFCLEGTLIGVLGAFVGAAIGLILSTYYQINGIDFSTLGENLDVGYRINTVMYCDINGQKVFTICLLAVLFCLLASYLAVRKSTDGEIAEQLRSI